MVDDPYARRKLIACFAVAIILLILLIGEAMQNRKARFWLGVCVCSLVALVALLSVAFARDVGQWTNVDPKIHEWYQHLTRPDMPGSICCTEADAYWADEVHVRNGKMYVVVTDDRDDGPLHRPHIPNGTEIEVPPEKLKYDEGNPTGHGVLFVSTSGFTWCYVMGSGT